MSLLIQGRLVVSGNGLEFGFLERTKRAKDGRAIWKRPSVDERLASRTNFFGPIPSDNPSLGACWIWTGYLNEDGYGNMGDGNRGMTSTHRLSYLLHVGEIPDNLVIDHLCRNRACCNPAHMEAVTQEENIRRGEATWVVSKKNGVCRNGHPKNYDGECRVCMKNRNPAKRLKKVAYFASLPPEEQQRRRTEASQRTKAWYQANRERAILAARARRESSKKDDHELGS